MIEALFADLTHQPTKNLPGEKKGGGAPFFLLWNFFLQYFDFWSGLFCSAFLNHFF
ncbi:hypothetical protein CHISP_0777 [Chitinispirillum alkaliphilum]|nr:hypothetical protein CHISP_0777 [Chitinispirillum alkaliphilum]